MQTKDRLTRIFLAVLLSAFPLLLAGETQITITAEYKGKIREQKPHGLFHPSPDPEHRGLSPEQVAILKEIIKNTDLVIQREALENTIVLDLYEKGSYAALLNEASTYLDLYPQGDPVFRPHILFHMAEAYYYQGEYQEAMLRYRELMTEHSASEVYTFAWQGLAWCLMHLGRYGEARNEFRQLAPTTPEGYVAAIYGRAINEFNDEKYGEAVGLFRDEEGYRQIPLEGIWGPLSKSLVPSNLYYRALANDRLGDQQSAIVDLRRVAEDYPRHPKSGPSTYLVGWLSFNIGEYDQAVLYFQKALARVGNSTDSLEILTNLSQAYYNGGRLPEAIDNWKQIRRTWGDMPVVLTGLEQCFTLVSAEVFSGEFGIFPTDSIEKLMHNFALELPESKDLPLFRLQLAQRFYDDGNYRKTLEWAALATAGQANEEIIHDAKGLRLYAHFALKDWEKLADEGESYYETYPRDIDTELLFAIGVGYSSRGDDIKETNPSVANDYFRKAVPLFERYLREASPENANVPIAQQLLAYCRSQSQ